MMSENNKFIGARRVIDDYVKFLEENYKRDDYVRRTGFKCTYPWAPLGVCVIYDLPEACMFCYIQHSVEIMASCQSSIEGGQVPEKIIHEAEEVDSNARLSSFDEPFIPAHMPYRIRRKRTP